MHTEDSGPFLITELSGALFNTPRQDLRDQHRAALDHAVRCWRAARASELAGNYARCWELTRAANGAERLALKLGDALHLQRWGR